ncbi:MAG TPA: arylsulfatase [Chitinophagaceae bacterium]
MRSMFYVAALFFVSACTVTNVPAQQKRPNIIVILADDLGWGDVGYHGSDIKTPNIDKLAKEGIELTRFYTAPVCSPTRAGLLTGRYPDRFGLRGVIPPWSTFGVDTTETFLPALLEQAGYKNRALVGKWHLGHASIAFHPLQRGFTHFYGHLNGNLDYFTHVREGQLDWHNDYKPSYDKGYSTDLLANEAIRCIKQYNDKQSPFFIYLAFNAPHAPLQAKKEDLLKYGFDETKPVFGNKNGEGIEGRGNTKRQTYAAMVSSLDENIGRVLQALKDLNIDDNTIVLFQSDNGAEINEGGSAGELRGKKGTEWEGGVRAPAIIKWPAGLKGGRTSDQLMGYIDVLPTLLEAAGVKNIKLQPGKTLDGISMLDVLKDGSKQKDRVFYLGEDVIISQNWKLIRAAGSGQNMNVTEDQLFNIATDPTEKDNVIKKEALAAEELKKKLEPFSSIQPSATAPPFNTGKKDFVAPKEWTIPKNKP